jgi:hypothetical protein
MRASIFSLISINGDRSDYLRAVQRAAEGNEICGMFLSQTLTLDFATSQMRNSPSSKLPAQADTHCFNYGEEPRREFRYAGPYCYLKYRIESVL